ncbi:MAG: hypothetical protein VKP57_10805 [Candidatus Sericytochromatia bacterium]|nr:hypothetical protein [Candidatus Sericytochromatia bacterium]
MTLGTSSVQEEFLKIDGQRLVRVTPAGPVTVLTSPLLNSDAIGAMDSQGNLFTHHHFDCTVNRITPAGAVTRFAGNGSAGFADGQGSAARFNRPSGMTIDAQDNLYVSDYWNHRIRKITPAGLVTTFAGTGQAGSVDGAAGVARFSEPISICRDAQGYFWLADHNAHRIRRVAPDGTVTTLRNGAGTPVQYTYPLSLTYSDRKAGIVVTPKFASRIDFIDLAGNLQNVVQGGGLVDGPLATARVGSYAYVGQEPAGTILVFDNGRLRRMVLP